MLQQLITKQKHRDIRAQDILAFMTVRNEHLRLPASLNHYRRIGVDRFFIVDNGSSDGTIDFLSAQDDVDLFVTEESYAESKFGMDWQHTLMDRFANGHWIVSVDADELFIYPHYETTNLKRLCAFLDQTRATAMLSILLDMYSDKAIDQTAYRCGDSLLDACSYFDGGPYKILRSPLFPHLELRGGPRARVFWDADVRQRQHAEGLRPGARLILCFPRGRRPGAHPRHRFEHFLRAAIVPSTCATISKPPRPTAFRRPPSSSTWPPSACSSITWSPEPCSSTTPRSP